MPHDMLVLRRTEGVTRQRCLRAMQPRQIVRVVPSGDCGLAHRVKDVGRGNRSAAFTGIPLGSGADALFRRTHGNGLRSRGGGEAFMIAAAIPLSPDGGASMRGLIGS